MPAPEAPASWVPPSYPPPVVEAQDPLRSARFLTAQQKQRLWAHLKAHDPALAELLASPEVRSLLGAFPGAAPAFSPGLIRQALESSS